ncbi:MAG: DoxX family protein [Candidatus Aminicenantes bacterium]|jgi:putative oxidoreductase|nr:DoxX family protein [Candidatus Aminicenantes bacterium]
MQALIQLLARFFIAFIFLMSGLGKIMNLSGTQQYMAQYGMPLTYVFLIGAICAELLGGLSVLTGYKAKWGAFVLFLFLIPTTLIFHTEFSDQTQVIMFMKNLAIIGGLLLLVSHGAGKISLDAFKTAK